MTEWRESLALNSRSFGHGGKDGTKEGTEDGKPSCQGKVRLSAYLRVRAQEKHDFRLKDLFEMSSAIFVLTIEGIQG
jgi:hypothetical protein